MKKTIFLSAILLLGMLSVQGHVIFLKNGDRIHGNVQGGKSDTILFSLMGSTLRVPLHTMEAIYFTDSLAPQDIYNQPNPKSARLRGLISYNQVINDAQTSEPDQGSRVWVVDSAAISDFNMAVVDSFTFATAYREIRDQYEMAGVPVPSDVSSLLRYWNADNDTVYEDISRRASREIYNLKSSPKAYRSTANEDGYFMFNLYPGTYYVFIISRNNQGGNIVEIEGKVFCKKIVATNEEEVTLKHSFSIF